MYELLNVDEPMSHIFPLHVFIKASSVSVFRLLKAPAIEWFLKMKRY